MVIRIDVVPRLPVRARDAHKGSCGTVLIVAGSAGMLGAAILAARAALRGGAGLVRVALPAELTAPLTIAVPPATTLDRASTPAATACAGIDALVIGPGLGQSAGTLELIEGYLGARAAVPLLLDADALNLLAPWSRRDRLAGAVITPHPGEAARLLGSTVACVQADREAAACELAERTGAVTVLKGAGTIVTDGRELFVNTTGNPGLGSGGTGDVLAGLCGALLAQGMAPFPAARLAVHVHGAAGDRVASRLSRAGLCADDLPLAIAEELRSFEDS